MIQNNVSIRLTPEEFDAVQKALALINNTLTPYLIQLTPEQRRQLPKMSDKTTPFVEKSLELAEQYPQFVPEVMDVNELKIDFESVQTLRTLHKPLEKIYDQLSDTILLAGSEAYTASLAYFNNVRAAVVASEQTTAEAQQVFEELNKRF